MPNIKSIPLKTKELKRDANGYAISIHHWHTPLAYARDSPIPKRLIGWTTDNGIGKWSQLGLCLLEDTDSSTGGSCAILSSDLDAQERSLSFTYGKPEES